MVRGASALVMAVVASLASPAGAQEPSAHRLVVLTAKVGAGPHLAPQAKTLVESPLARSATILAASEWQTAAQAEKLKPAQSTTLASVRLLAPKLALTHVLLLEGAIEKEATGAKPRSYPVVDVTLVAGPTGEVLLTQRIRLQGRKLTPVVAAQIIKLVREKLAGTPSATPVATAAPAKVEAPTTTPIAAPQLPATPVTPPPDAVASAPLPPQAPPPPTSFELPLEVTPPTPPPTAPATPEPAASAQVTTVAETPVASASVVDTHIGAAKSTQPATWRPGFIAAFAPTVLMRTASVEGEGQDPTEYAGPMVGARLSAEVYPAAFAGRGEWIEGIGLAGEVFYSRVRTTFEDDDETSVDDNVWSGRAGLAARFVLGKQATSPDVTALLGYGALDFPVSRGAFPGVGHSGVYAGLKLGVPLPHGLGAVADFDVSPMLSLGETLASVGTDGSGYAMRANLGVRYALAPVELWAMGHFSQFAATFSGRSDLDIAPQYRDAKLVDRTLGVSVGVGFSY